MSTPPVLPDVLYLKTREDLLPYEDARFQSLQSAVPNSYTTLGDYTIWGSVQRAVAQELARIEYWYAYDIVSLNPQFLTPADIKRRWAAPLFINKSFPNPAQTDQAYKAMLVALIPAYRQGTTLKAIEDVIEAYTNQPIEVVELYKLIGQGIYNDSDRNTLLVSVPAIQTNPLSLITAAAYLQTVSQDLYTAIDLAKPAHIGLNYSILFNTDENLDELIMDITDIFNPTFYDSEAAPLPPIFTQAPFELPTSPDTRLTAYGQIVGYTFALNITAVEWAALTTAYQGEYLENLDGSYTLDPARYQDVLLVDDSGTPTGAISKAVGVLAPRLSVAWEIKSDALSIFEMD